MSSVGRIWAIALNTFREAVRMRVLYGIVALVLGANAIGLLMSEINAREQVRMLRDIAVSSISFFGSMIAIFLGVILLYVEVQRRTIHSIVCKPLERWEFVLGKYFGMTLVLSVLTSLFIGCMLALMLLNIGHAADQVQGELGVLSSNVMKATTLAFLEIATVAAIAIFFSSFSSPFLSGMFALGIFAVGRLTPDIAAIAAKQSGLGATIMKGLLWVIPDLHTFSVSGREVAGQHMTIHEDFVAWSYVGGAGIYAVLWTVGLLTLACVIFQRRDFV